MTAPDLLSRLGRLTPARVRLDGSMRPLPMDAVLSFHEDHAAARDAIHGTVDWDALRDALAPLRTLGVASRAVDRATYLRRPDLGRQLDPAASLPVLDCPLLIVIGDGLSAPAVTAQAAGLVRELALRLPELRQVPVILAQGARVALADAVGAAARARMVLMLIGERPGLSVSDSLGAYLTHAPAPGLRDSARNCVSNIHGRGGLSHSTAADRLTWLIARARQIGATGVALKDESGPVTLVRDR